MYATLQASRLGGAASTFAVYDSDNYPLVSHFCIGPDRLSASLMLQNAAYQCNMPCAAIDTKIEHGTIAALYARHIHHLPSKLTLR